MTHDLLDVTDEVATALAEGRPVVALESTIISHGMPYPRNVEMALEVEGIVRDGGPVPATIAVLDGRPRIGLRRDDLELLASDPDVLKVSVRDLPYVVARGTAFYQREEVKNALAYLRVVANPDDSVSLERIINTPARGIGDTSLEKLATSAALRGQTLIAALRAGW